MSDFLTRDLPCFECSSSDAMQESLHHYKCFSCGKTFLKRDLGEVKVTEPENNRPKTFRDMLPLGGIFPLKSRGLTKETAQKFKITCDRYTGTFGHGEKAIAVTDHWVFQFNKYSNGQLVSQKIRSCEEKHYMKMLGDTSNRDLYGQWLWQPNPSRFIIITEGEFDAASIWQATQFSAVSINNGAESALKNIKENIDWLSKWAYVILAFDNDEPGKRATQAIIDANIFEPGKLRIAYWPQKDANDMILNGQTDLIRRVIWDAEEYKPQDILSPADVIDSVLLKPKTGTNTPWLSLTSSTLGWRPNTITCIAAADGIGKTEIVEEIINTLTNDNNKVWIYSCEQEPEDLLRRQAGKILQLPLHLPGAKWDEEKIKESVMKLQDKLYIWRPEKAVSTDEFFAKMRYSAIAYNTKFFILDHLKGIESQLTDPLKGMGKFMCDLKGFVKIHNACAIILSHVAKDKKQGKAGQTDESWNRGRVPTKESIYGSSAITAWADTILGLSRNVEAEDPYEACITKISILKNRLMGNRGQKALYLQYIEDTGTLIELPQVDYEAYFEDDKDDK